SRVGQRADGVGCRGGLRIGVDAHLAEVVPESGLEIGPRRRAQGLPGGAQHLVRDAGRLTQGSSRSGGVLLASFLRLASRAFTVELRWCGANGKLPVGYAHNLVSDTICLKLGRIVDLSENEFRLNDTWLRQ